MTNPLTLDIAWTDDCQGKKDYDGSIVVISTRYWPRGGGFTVFNTSTGIFADNSDRPEIKPSAHCTVYLEDGYPDSNGRTVGVLDRSFEGETFEEVKAQVEQWAQDQANRVYRAVAREFGVEIVETGERNESLRTKG